MQEILSKKDIGERIRNLRLAQDLSQLQVADILHLSRSNYSQIELGNQYPSFNTLHSLARYFSCSYEWLLHGSQTDLIPFKEKPTGTKTIPQLLANPVNVYDQQGRSKILLVPLSHQQYYIHKHSSQKFLNTLESVDFPTAIEDGTIYRAFKAAEELPDLNVHKNDILLAKHINTYAKVHINQVYILITRKEIKTCLLTGINHFQSTLSCTSQTDKQVFTVPFGDVLEIWEGTGKYTAKLGPVIGELEKTLKNFTEALQRLEGEITALKSVPPLC